jgi:transposase
MVYDKKLKERAIDFKQSGASLDEVAKIFQVHRNTIHRWEKEFRESGKIREAEYKGKAVTIYPEEELRDYIDKFPTALLADIAEAFGGSISGAGDALKRYKISLKR